MFPQTLMVGMEIRVKVSAYVMDRITALRQQHPDMYQNVACIRTNAMKYLPNYFKKGQVLCIKQSQFHALQVETMRQFLLSSYCI